MSYPEELARNHPVLSEILRERQRQDDKWGEPNHTPDRWLVILMEEVGEASNAVLNAHYCSALSDLREYRREMIQVAAVAVAAIESLDRCEAKR